MMEPMHIDVTDVPGGEIIPPLSARIMLGGRLTSFSGCVPGPFDEALVSLEKRRPVYVLGGFGGSAETLANAILKNEGRPKEFTADWLAEKNEKLARLHRVAGGFTMPPDILTTEVALDRLFYFLHRAHDAPAEVLCTGLSDDETRELLLTRSVATAAHLVRLGLTKMDKLSWRRNTED
jgi:hypothetical protein